MKLEFKIGRAHYHKTTSDSLSPVTKRGKTASEGKRNIFQTL